ncbi:hypothetical protein Tco_1191113 [Tanacetum coccineum]
MISILVYASRFRLGGVCQSEYDEVEQNVLYFNDLFPFNIIYPDDLKSDKDNDDNEIDIIRSSRGNVNTQGSNKLLKASHDKINKIFIMESFIMESDVNIIAWNYLNNGMLLNLIKNLYVPFGIPFDPKRYYKDGGCTRKLQRPRTEWLKYYNLCTDLIDFTDMALPPRNQRHQYLRFEGLQYTDADITDFEMRLGKIYSREDADGAQGCSRIGSSSYTSIRDSMLRLCHRLITYSIVGRSQAPEKVTMTDLFYLKGMDVSSVNIQGAMISGGQFVARLIDMAELVRLQICEELDDTWAWVASRPDRKQVVATGAAKAAEDASVVDEGAPAVPTPVWHLSRHHLWSDQPGLWHRG